jgi:hypothetical protein
LTHCFRSYFKYNLSGGVPWLKRSSEWREIKLVAQHGPRKKRGNQWQSYHRSLGQSWSSRSIIRECKKAMNFGLDFALLLEDIPSKRTWWQTSWL